MKKQPNWLEYHLREAFRKKEIRSIYHLQSVAIDQFNNNNQKQ